MNCKCLSQYLPGIVSKLIRLFEYLPVYNGYGSHLFSLGFFTQIQWNTKFPDRSPCSPFDQYDLPLTWWIIKNFPFEVPLNLIDRYLRPIKTAILFMHNVRCKTARALMYTCFLSNFAIVLWLIILSMKKVKLSMCSFVSHLGCQVCTCRLLIIVFRKQTADWLTDWLTNLLIDWLIHWLTDGLIDGLNWFDLSWVKLKWFDWLINSCFPLKLPIQLILIVFPSGTSGQTSGVGPAHTGAWRSKFLENDWNMMRNHGENMVNPWKCGRLIFSGGIPYFFGGSQSTVFGCFRELDALMCTDWRLGFFLREVQTHRKCFHETRKMCLNFF